jgi:competence protein ComFC
MLLLLKKLGKSFLDFIYPPHCLHCHGCLEEDCYVFCRTCSLLLEQIDPNTRCPFCFSIEFDQEFKKCNSSCKQYIKHVKRIASVFDYEGPSASLVKHMKYGGQDYLAKGGGAYLAAQFLALDWPKPDYIIPMPMSRLRKWERGYNQSELLAESLGKLIDVKVSNALCRKSGDFSQAGLNHQQRLNLKNDSFYVKNGDCFHGKIILLLDDVMTTGSSLICCAETLVPYFPEAIYALTLCRTISSV